MLNYSMCPNGAMLICESISEYDPNVAAPPAPTMAAVIKEGEMKDPVVHVKDIFGEIYKSRIMPLLNMNLSAEQRSGEELTADLDTLNRTVSDVFEKLAICIAKKTAMAKALSSCDKELLKLEFNSHRGLFIRKASIVHQQGVETYHVSETRFPAVSDWTTEQVIRDIAMHLDEFSNGVVTNDIITGLCGGDCGAIGKSFTGFIDLNNCLFSDYDRYARLETTNNASIDFDWLIRNEYLCGCPVGDEKCNLNTTLTKAISQFIRKSKCSIYDMSLAIIDGTIDPSWYNCEVKRIVTNAYNLFTISVLYIFKQAYLIRNAMEYKNAIKNYTELLLRTLKSV